MLHMHRLYIPFFKKSPTGQTPGRISARDGANDAVSRKGVPLWVKKLKLIFDP